MTNHLNRQYQNYTLFLYDQLTIGGFASVLSLFSVVIHAPRERTCLKAAKNAMLHAVPGLFMEQRRACRDLGQWTRNRSACFKVMHGIELLLPI